jgi:hypothetical protein
MIFFLVFIPLLVIMFAYLAWRAWDSGKAYPDPDDGYGISLLIPYTTDNGPRMADYNWLKQYYLINMPGAQLVTWGNWDVPFCKTQAVNDAFAHCDGDVVVILDADCYIDVDVILNCAQRIREAREANRKLWFIPYRHFYRLTEAATQLVLDSEPTHPYVFPDPPAPGDLASNRGNSSGHWYGALIQIMPREAFELVGGMDTRFSGWGGEDIAFMRAVDTLYARHKTTSNAVFHLWHPTIRGYDDDTRMWEGQTHPDGNWPLATRYADAFGDREKMRSLVSGDDV